MSTSLEQSRADSSRKAVASASSVPKLLVRGVHHLVFTTEDMRATIDFYMNIFGMRLVHGFKTEPGVAAASGQRGNPPFENIRHYFMDMGNDSVLAFFELPKAKMPKSDRNAIGGMQHVSFCVENADEFEALQKRLRDHGVAFYGPIRMTSGPGFSIYFYDPNGVRLEASCDPTGSATRNIIPHITQTKSAIRAELKTLCDDEAWLDRVTASLPD